MSEVRHDVRDERRDQHPLPELLDIDVVEFAPDVEVLNADVELLLEQVHDQLWRLPTDP